MVKLVEQQTLARWLQGRNESFPRIFLNHTQITGHKSQIMCQQRVGLCWVVELQRQPWTTVARREAGGILLTKESTF